MVRVNNHRVKILIIVIFISTLFYASSLNLKNVSGFLLLNNNSVKPKTVTIKLKLSDSLFLNKDSDKPILRDTIYVGKVESISLNGDYNITFGLDLDTVKYFQTFCAFIMIYEPSLSPDKASPQVGSLKLYNTDLIGPSSGSMTLNSGKYDIFLKISYYTDIMTPLDEASVDIKIIYRLLG